MDSFFIQLTYFGRCLRPVRLLTRFDRMLSLCFLILVVSVVPLNAQIEFSGKYEMTFTTGLNSRNRPTDSIEEISVTQGKVYLYTRWSDLGDAPHKYVCEIFNSYGQLVFRDEKEFRSRTGSYSTWTFHRLIEDRDRSGDWRFVVYFDDRRVAARTLIVLDADRKRYDPERIRTMLERVPSLEKALSRYRSLESYRDSVELTTVRSGPAQESRVREKIVFETQLPNRILQRYFLGSAEILVVVSDGANIWTCAKGPEKVCSVDKVPKDPVGQIAGIPPITTVVQMILFSLDPARELLEYADSTSEAAAEEPGGPGMRKVEIRYSPPLKPPLKYHLDKQGNATLSLWIDSTDYLIRKSTVEVVSDRASLAEGYVVSSPFDRILKSQVFHPEINPKFDDSHFVFVPPDTAKSAEERRTEHESRYPVMVGKNLPDFTLKDTEGSEVTLDDFRGTVVLIEFWGGWSPLSRERFPLLKKLKSAYGNQGFEILGFSVGDSAIGAKQMAQAYRLNYPVLMVDEKTQEEFGMTPGGLPTSILTDRKGVVRYIHNTRNLSSLQKQVEDLMAEGTSTEAFDRKAGLVPRIQMFVGRWENVDPEIEIMKTVEIRLHDGRLEVQAWSFCQPKDCNWGVGKQFFVDSQNGVISLFWRRGNIRHRQLLTLSTKHRIQILGHTIDKEGRPAGEYTCVFERVESEDMD